jgi:C4-dicarboxylate-specific signal transduction histidine kinase
MKNKPFILIVHGSRDCIMVMRRFLNHEGYWITAAQTCEQATDIIVNTVPDIALIDIHMPGGSAMEMCKKIKTSPQTKHTSVLFMVTPATDVDEIMKGFDAGADDFIARPLEARSLQTRVRIHLKRLEHRRLKDKEMESMIRRDDRLIALGRVSAGIAHEIRNPLSTINVYLSILRSILKDNEKKLDPDEDLCEILDELESGSRRIAKIVTRVVDFARPGTPMLSQTPINQCIHEAVSLSSVRLRKEGIALECLLGEDVPECLLESQSISQVFLNLIANAADSLKNQLDNKKIVIRSWQENGYVIAAVSDSGPGILLENREKIFAPFFTTKPAGMGIGLSISQRIIADHGGSLSLSESSMGGSEFRVSLPVLRAPQEMN